MRTGAGRLDTGRDLRTRAVEKLKRIGESAIYAGGFAVRVKDVSEEEFRELLEWAGQWVTQPKYVHRHRWRLHDLVFWDNRRVMHHATPYPEHMRRHMHRTTVEGSAPYFDPQYFARELSSTP